MFSARQHCFKRVLFLPIINYLYLRVHARVPQVCKYWLPIFVAFCINCYKYKIYFTFVECTIGYFAKDCKLRCPYPSYGEECQEICNCSKVTCDFVSGCTKRRNSGMKLFSLLFIILTKCLKKNHTCRL